MRVDLEAAMRLKVMRYQFRLEKDIENNYEDGKLMVTLVDGDPYFIDDEDLGDTFTGILNNFNSKYPDYHVYHMIELGGPRLAIMYVGPIEDEWDDERMDDEGYLSCYVYNALIPDYSEFGEVQIKESNFEPLFALWED